MHRFQYGRYSAVDRALVGSQEQQSGTARQGELASTQEDSAKAHHAEGMILVAALLCTLMRGAKLQESRVGLKCVDDYWHPQATMPEYTFDWQASESPTHYRACWYSVSEQRLHLNSHM